MKEEEKVWENREGKELIAWKRFSTPAWPTPPPNQCHLCYRLSKSVPDYLPT